MCKINHSFLYGIGLLYLILFQNKHNTDSSFEVQNELLKGHLGITKELLAYHSVQKHYQVGCEDDGEKLLLVSISKLNHDNFLYILHCFNFIPFLP